MVQTWAPIESEIDGLEIDEEEDDTPLEIPSDRRRVKTDKQDVPVETIHTRVQSGRLDLQPDFQRYFVWNRTKASRLIESILLDIPIPVIYVAEEPDHRSVVVDGQQRLTSICAFIDGTFPDGAEFRLSGLQVMSELNGKTFRDLDTSSQEFIYTTALRLIIIKMDSDPDVRFEVFERLNLGSVKLNDQELRNCIYRGNYNALLRDLAQNQHMLKIMGLKEPHYRMADRQLILRFFAMWRSTHLHYHAPMKGFLNREMQDHGNPSDKEIAEMRGLFEKSIEMAFTVFGHSAFRRFRPGSELDPNGSWEKNKLNVALWDTLLYGFGFFQKSQVIPNADSIREEFLDLITNDQKFVEFITSTTDKPDRVQYRAQIWLQRLHNLLDGTPIQPRSFSLELKQRLFDENPTCGICGQHVYDIDDAEIDHLKHYWRGGETIPSNARLTHRYCNRARGGQD